MWVTNDDFVRITVLIIKEYTACGIDVHNVMFCNMAVKAHQFPYKNFC